MSLSIEQQRKERFETYASSGLSKTAFCRAHDIPYHQFFYWMKKLTGTPSNPSAPVQWMALDVTNAQDLTPASPPIHLQVGNVCIELHEGFNETLLRHVVKVLANG
jgi:hypothetical protein